MEFKDYEITCQDCQELFVFTAGEQLFYRDKGLTPPHRCPDCRAKRKVYFENRGKALCQ